MPAPKEGESEQEYVSRCIPIVLNEMGDDSENKDNLAHAQAKCYGMYRQWKKKK